MNFKKQQLKGVEIHGDSQVGTRTVNILMGEHAGEYVRGDILDANATAILIKNLHNPDIEKLKEQIEEARRKLANAVMNENIGVPGGVASLDSTGNVPIDQLANISTDLFIVVSELPTEDIKENKIYCIKDTSSTAQDNGYIEYSYINNKWEKIGEFQAQPDLSKYAKLGGNAEFETLKITSGFQSLSVSGYAGFNQVTVNGLWGPSNVRNHHTVFDTYGKTADIGTPEDFVFTLEDGSTVTKSIRVISTTNQAGA